MISEEKRLKLWTDDRTFGFGQLMKNNLQFILAMHSLFSSPEPKAPGGAYSIGQLRRPSTVSNDFSFVTTGPIATKYHIQPPGSLWKKSVQIVRVIRPRWPPCPYMVKTLKKSSTPEPIDQ